MLYWTIEVPSSEYLPIMKIAILKLKIQTNTAHPFSDVLQSHTHTAQH